jgi:hypothetical protein
MTQEIVFEGGMPYDFGNRKAYQRLLNLKNLVPGLTSNQAISRSMALNTMSAWISWRDGEYQLRLTGPAYGEGSIQEVVKVTLNGRPLCLPGTGFEKKPFTFIDALDYLASVGIIVEE